MRKQLLARFWTAALLATAVWIPPTQTLAHCDALDGPVIALAQKALAENDVKWVLPWVQKQDETAVRHAFNQAIALRDQQPEVRQLAETHFFETLVRLHRQAEGAPYTGLKPAATDRGPAIPAADRALESGDIERVVVMLQAAVEKGVREHYAKVMARKRAYAPEDVAAGRQYVDAYVTYIHYVEHLWETANAPVSGHYPEPGPAAARKE